MQTSVGLYRRVYYPTIILDYPTIIQPIYFFGNTVMAVVFCLRLENVF
jgi:hypothetical protein